MAFDAFVQSTIPPIQNRPDVYGEQWIMNEEDVVTARFQTLLVTASSIGIDDVAALVGQYGGAAFPAHIDRPSYSVTAALGTIPAVGFMAMEVSARGDVAALTTQYTEMKGKPLLLSSDAHYLHQIQECGPWLELPHCTPEALIDTLSGKFTCAWGRELE